MPDTYHESGESRSSGGVPMSRQLDDGKVNEFLAKVVADVGSAMSAALVVIGDKVGLWRALANSPDGLSSTELACRTDTAERYVREWLNAMAAGGYLTYDAGTGRYCLPAEHAVALA